MNLIQFAIGCSGISIVIIFIAKFAIKWIGDAGIEKYKNELKQETLAYQNKLEKDLESYKIKSTRLHFEQVEIIKNLYSKLIRAEYPLEYLMRPVKWGIGKTDQEIAEEVKQHSNDFFQYFDENEIILNEETCRLITTIRTKLISVWNTYSDKQFAQDNSIRGEDFVQTIKKMREAYDNILLGEIQDLKKELKIDFRDKLGIIERVKQISVV